MTMIRRAVQAVLIALTLSLGLAGCGGGSGSSVVPPGQSPSLNATATKLPVSAYRLGSGDRIRVNIFRHDDLSGEFALDDAGNFAMPLIGEVHAGGQTTRDLEQRIADKLKDGYLVDPQVSVEVLNYRPFYILGEVKQPGSYQFVNGMTVLNAVALSGGFTYRAAQDSIVVRRGGANAAGVVVTGDSAILPGDVIEVPERFF